jgi:hypothetical protein
MSEFLSHPYILVGLLFLNWPIYRVLADAMFEGRDDVSTSLWYTIMPNWISFLRGEWWRDMKAESVMALYWLFCFSIVGVEYWGIVSLIDWASSL